MISVVTVVGLFHRSVFQEVETLKKEGKPTKRSQRTDPPQGVVASKAGERSYGGLPDGHYKARIDLCLTLPVVKICWCKNSSLPMYLCGNCMRFLCVQDVSGTR